MISETCPVCGGTERQEVFILRNLPLLCDQLWPDIAAARAAPAGDVELFICDTCALIWNRACEPERMTNVAGYERALHYSPKFQTIAEELAERLVSRHGLAGRDVIEIGCGDGYMLHLMKDLGARSATGFDPSMAGKTTLYMAREGVEIVPEHFRSDHLDRPFDVILCRHALDDLEPPLPLLMDIRHAIGERDVPVYFNVPNAGWKLDSVSMWDMISDHVAYWTAPSLTTLLRRAGFALASAESVYDGQFLMLEAKAVDAEPGFLPRDADSTKAAARAFAMAANTELANWRDRLTNITGRAVIWGAGPKSITFANALGAAGACLTALVDVNPGKHGLIAPGAGIPVVTPDALNEIRPDLVLISDALCQAEITEQVRSMGLAPAFGVIAG